MYLCLQGLADFRCFQGVLSGILEFLAAVKQCQHCAVVTSAKSGPLYFVHMP